jgi:hypothetical protein
MSHGTQGVRHVADDCRQTQNLHAGLVTGCTVRGHSRLSCTKSALLRGGSIGCDALEFFDSLQGNF